MGFLDGTIAVVTGAGRGLGKEHALLLAQEGARVVVNDLGGATDGTGRAESPAMQVVDEITTAGGVAVANNDDVASAEGAQRLVETALDAFGDLHILINNAGILRDRVLVNMSDEDWDVVVRVNLRGTMLTSRAAGRHWRARSKSGQEGHAAIVNTSSESGVFGNAGQANYAAAKAAVATLAQVCAKELSRYGARANAILPRARTRLTESIIPQPKEGVDFDRWDPANVSPFVAYLASPACTLNGETFLVGGSIVQRVRPWELDPEWKLKTDGRWTLDELHQAVEEAGEPARERDTGYIK